MAVDEQYDSQHFLVDSVNILLQTIGELPITTLEDIDNVLEAQIAQTTLIEAKMQVLAYGWDINTDASYPFQVDESGYVNIPANVLDLNVSGKNIIIRDWKLYDKDTQSRLFTGTQYCDVVWNVNFETITHPLRYYITLVAARIFQDRMISDSSIHQYTEKDEQRALIAAKHSNGYTGEFNMLNSSYGTNFNVLSN